MLPVLVAVSLLLVLGIRDDLYIYAAAVLLLYTHIHVIDIYRSLYELYRITSTLAAAAVSQTMRTRRITSAYLLFCVRCTVAGWLAG